MAQVNGSKIYLSPKEAAIFLELSPDILYRLRLKPGNGPRYHRRAGRIHYHRDDLRRWNDQTIKE